MKIALLGYGKMGQTIEKIAVSRGHEIVLTIDKDSPEYDISVADVAIDFSIPSSAVDNITNCLNNNIPIISGTTGWLDHFEDMKKLCSDQKGAFLQPYLSLKYVQRLRNAYWSRAQFDLLKRILLVSLIEKNY